MENTIGKQISKLRNSRGYTQEDLANKIDVSKQTVSNWETGLKTPRMGAIQKIADHFNVSKSFIIDGKEKEVGINSIYDQLTEERKVKVYSYAKYQLSEQNKRPTLNIIISGYVSAGTGEWLDDTIKEEVEYQGVIPEHDFAVKVIGDSMIPLFDDGQVIFIEGTSEARDGQIVVCEINNEAYVKKLSGDRLVSLNRNYCDIKISETDDFKIFGIVVL